MLESESFCITPPPLPPVVDSGRTHVCALTLGGDGQQRTLHVNQGIERRERGDLQSFLPGGLSEDGNISNGNGGRSRSVPDKGRRGELYRCGSGVCDRTAAAQPIFAQKSTAPPSMYRPSWLGSPHTNKNRDNFVLLDAWLLFFSKKVNVLIDLRRKYVCRSARALLERYSFGVPFRYFYVFWWHRET